MVYLGGSSALILVVVSIGEEFSKLLYDDLYLSYGGGGTKARALKLVVVVEASDPLPPYLSVLDPERVKYFWNSLLLVI